MGLKCPGVVRGKREAGAEPRGSRGSRRVCPRGSVCGVPASGQREGSPGREKSESPGWRVCTHLGTQMLSGPLAQTSLGPWVSGEEEDEGSGEKTPEACLQRAKLDVRQNLQPGSRTPRLRGPQAQQLQPTLTHLGGGKPLEAHVRLGR